MYYMLMTMYRLCMCTFWKTPEMGQLSLGLMWVICGGVVASWLVRSTPEQTLWV